jgi:anhydro-N-acetylmuramic acid kinase
MADWLTPLAKAAAHYGGVYVGLMSGTSADAVDVAVVALVDEQPPRVLASHAFPYPARLRDRLLAAIAGEARSDEINQLHTLVGEAFGLAVNTVLDAGEMPPEDVVAIGSHGQTIWHRPPAGNSPRGATLQIGNPATIAARTGIPVVSDFRSADMAQDGQGAPLVPYVDWLLFTDSTRSRALQNIGGIGNVTYLAAGAAPEDVVAFDTGPGNALIDLAVEALTGGAAQMDVDGRIAGQGTLNAALLEKWMQEPYLDRKPPKSTGRELFGRDYADRCLADARSEGCPEADALATITALTAQSIAQAYATLFPAAPDEIIISGGGRLNPTLTRMLRGALDARGIRAPFRALEDWGIGAESKEAVAFAILARETLRGVPANLPSVTGARLPVILGSVTPAPPRR